MDKRALQSYAVWAKKNLENQIEVQLKTLGINSERDIKTARLVGDRTIIDGDMNSYPADFKNKRDSIVRLVQEDGYKQIIEEFAYTWFNRIVALRFMEVHDFLPHGFRVLSSRTGGFEPEIMKNLNFVRDELKLDLSVVAPLMEQGKIDEAYRYVLFRQCNALSGILPMLFSSEQSYLELLLPKALLKGETFITKLLEIGEDSFLDDVEVIGWLYQFYVASDRQKFRDAKVVTKDLIPTLTQVFTPDWIVRYMAENSVGRIWLESYPNSALKNEMKYYVEDVEQEAEVQRKLDEVKYKNVNPEDIKIIEPCCGSGHILVYVFDLLYKMYEEKGYTAREIPTLILKKNLTGLEIDKRATQLASFSLIMKARSVNSRFFNDNYYVVPEVYEIWDARGLFHSDYLNQIRETKLLNNQQIKDIEWLTETFRYAKTIGSLLIVEKKNFDSIRLTIDKLEKEAVINIFNRNFLTEGIKCLRHLLRQAEIMSTKYDVMITNPPYLGLTKIESNPKEYLMNKYPETKADMFAMFMEVPYTKTNGYIAMINPDGWMFIPTYEKFRIKFLKKYTISSMIHLGLGALDATVLTTSFVIKNSSNIRYKSIYHRLVNSSSKEKDFLEQNYVYCSYENNYSYIPGNTFAYWVDGTVCETFKNRPLSDFFTSRIGLVTGNVDRFLRYWYEVNLSKICFNPKLEKNKKWFLYQKGGAYRKWYGNNEYVVNWENNGYEMINDNFADNGRIKSHNYNGEFAFKEGITWTKITTGGSFSARKIKDIYMFDDAGCSGFVNDASIDYVLALLNSAIGKKYIEFFKGNDMNCLPGHLSRIPYIFDKNYSKQIIELTQENCMISENEWDEYESSFDFKIHPLCKAGRLADIYNDWVNIANSRYDVVKQNEELIDKLFKNIYGIEVECEDKYVALRKANVLASISSLISYLVGIEMGRYSLDVEGLAYAGGDWNPMNYVTYQPDDDGIIPVYPQLGMADGLTARIIKLIKHIYGEDTYKENIDFIADALGKKNSESSEETLNRYLNEGFYADHLKTYQKRPIYWMFSSGKNDAFKCLVYLHRYNEDTLARINSKYFLNESARLNAEVNDTAAQLEAAEGREKLRLDKLYKTLSAKQKEMLEYGWVLDHMANQYIPLDLDDGVKVNYTKFQGIEIVNDNGAKVKKDLLIPIK